MDENTEIRNDNFELDLPSAGLGALAFAALGGLACGGVWIGKKVIGKIKARRDQKVAVEVEPTKAESK